MCRNLAYIYFRRTSSQPRRRGLSFPGATDDAIQVTGVTEHILPIDVNVAIVWWVAVFQPG